MMNFNEISERNVTYDYIKTHQQSGPHSFSKTHNLGIATWGVKLTPPSPVFLGLSIRPGLPEKQSPKVSEYVKKDLYMKPKQ